MITNTYDETNDDIVGDFSTAEYIAETLNDLYDEGKLGKNKRVVRAYLQSLCVLAYTSTNLDITEAVLNAFDSIFSNGLEDYYPNVIDNEQFIKTTASMIGMLLHHAESFSDIVNYLKEEYEAKKEQKESTIGVHQLGELLSPRDFRDNLDELVLRRIAESREGASFNDIDSGPIYVLVEKAMREFDDIGQIHSRHVDRSLQRLRKREMIEFHSGKWFRH